VEAGVTSDVLSRPAPPPDLVVAYGSGPEHVADVRLPPGLAGLAHDRAAGRAPDRAVGLVPGGTGDLVPGGTAGPVPLVIFLHGGFWRSAFDRVHAGPLATALAAAGFAVCVPEYRRTGQRGGGWPGTFDDVAAAVDVLPSRVRAAVGAGLISAEPVLLAGHSAGGHLALWAASRHQLPPGVAWRAPRRRAHDEVAANEVTHDVMPQGAVPQGAVPQGAVPQGAVPRGVVALAAVTDMPACHALGLGQGAARALLGGGPGRHPDRYRLADPMRLLPVGCPVRLVHGSADDRVPCGMSRDYAARARAAGDDVVLDELPPWWPRVLAAFSGLAQP
jgi:acetyl esterase/lipase